VRGNFANLRGNRTAFRTALGDFAKSSFSTCTISHRFDTFCARFFTHLISCTIKQKSGHEATDHSAPYRDRVRNANQDLGRSLKK